MTPILDNLPGIRACFFEKEQEQTSGMAAWRLTEDLSAEDEMQILQHNRSVAATSLAFPQIELAMGIQVHGSDVLQVSHPGIYAQTDGLFTTTEGLAVAVLVADCAALLLADPVNRVVAAIHAGWRGAVAGIVQNGLQAMSLAGADPKHVRTWLSPCISTDAFEVGDEVAGKFPPQFVHTGLDRAHVDLQGYIKQVLMQSGVASSHIFHDNRCTKTEPDLFHSHRRDREKSGRMMAAIALCNV